MLFHCLTDLISVLECLVLTTSNIAILGSDNKIIFNNLIYLITRLGSNDNNLADHAAPSMSSIVFDQLNRSMIIKQISNLQSNILIFRKSSYFAENGICFVSSPVDSNGSMEVQCNGSATNTSL